MSQFWVILGSVWWGSLLSHFWVTLLSRAKLRKMGFAPPPPKKQVKNGRKSADSWVASNFWHAIFPFSVVADTYFSSAFSLFCPQPKEALCQVAGVASLVAPHRRNRQMLNRPQTSRVC